MKPTIEVITEELCKKAVNQGANLGNISDGHHTFNELYETRNVLFIALAKMASKEKDVWKSMTHSDGVAEDGWFILGINKRKGSQITFHLPIIMWDMCKFAETLETAPVFDGHSSKDVLERIAKMK
jgi:hypothetical protein